MQKIIAFINNLLNTIISVAKILIQSRFFLKFPKIYENGKKEIVVLGNGPSLNETLEKRKDLLEGRIKLCVNAFAGTPVYDEIKPEIYVFADPLLWASNPHERLRKNRENIFNNIISRTTWKLMVFIPASVSSKSEMLKQIETNPNVTVYKYNKTSIKGFRYFRNYCFRRKIGMPRAQNVLVPSLMISGQLGFKNIYLVGADHSWHENLVVDQKTNQLYFKDYHFYTEETLLKPIDNNIHEQFESLMIAFRNYHIIKDFADSRGIKIINASEKSYIDAFDRE